MKKCCTFVRVIFSLIVFKQFFFSTIFKSLNFFYQFIPSRNHLSQQLQWQVFWDIFSLTLSIQSIISSFKKQLNSIRLGGSENIILLSFATKKKKKKKHPLNMILLPQWLNLFPQIQGKPQRGLLSPSSIHQQH